MKVGDMVTIKPTHTHTPWKGKLTGKVIVIDEDGTVGIEVTDGNGMGHDFGGFNPGIIDSGNGWWFYNDEVELIPTIKKSR